MSDSVAVTSQLSVLFEAADDSDLEQPAHYTYLSAAAHMLKDDVLRPPVQLFTAGDTQRTAPVIFLSSSLPCDYEVTSLRPISDTDGQRWLLVLHRRAVDCQWRSTPHYCDVGEQQLNVTQFLS